MQTTRLSEGHPVLPIASAVVIQGQHTVGPFAVEGLSPYGARVSGDPPIGLVLGKATAIFSLSGGDIIRLPVNIGHLEWRSGQYPTVSLTFRELGPGLKDQIQKAVERHLERGRIPMIMVLSGGRPPSTDFRRAFHSLGREVVLAQSSLDALWFLERFPDACGTILIDHAFVKVSGPEILALLRDRFSAKRRVLVVPQSETDKSDLGLLGFAVHGVLTTPWTFEQLKSALGLFPAQAVKCPKRILFVDDEPAALSGLHHCLRRYLRTYETVWVTSGEAALAENSARRFNVVVADLRMPGMDGLMLLRAIKGQAPQAKRVILTGWDTPAAKDVADIVLHKPCPIDILRTEVLGAA